MRVLVCLLLLSFLPSAVFAGSGDLVADETSQTTQNARADADHLSRMTSVAMLRRFVRSGYLVKVPAGSQSYYLHGIDAEYRYCRPWTRLFLQRLSRQYYARFHQPLRITSLVRTVRSQTVLARYNPNAADAIGETRSSHLTGATVDISKRWMSPEAQEWMRTVLVSLRDAGYVYAIEEFEQPTFHIMVYRKYSGYAQRRPKRRLARAATLAKQAEKAAENKAADDDGGSL